jgi:hypothetical protein
MIELYSIQNLENIYDNRELYKTNNAIIRNIKHNTLIPLGITKDDEIERLLSENVTLSSTMYKFIQHIVDDGLKDEK